MIRSWTSQTFFPQNCIKSLRRERRIGWCTWAQEMVIVIKGVLLRLCTTTPTGIASPKGRRNSFTKAWKASPLTQVQRWLTYVCLLTYFLLLHLFSFFYRSLEMQRGSINVKEEEEKGSRLGQNILTQNKVGLEEEEDKGSRLGQNIMAQTTSF